MGTSRCSFYCSENFELFFRKSYRFGRVLSNFREKYLWHWSYFTFGVNFQFSWDITKGLSITRIQDFGSMINNINYSMHNLNSDYPLYLKASINSYNSLGEIIKIQSSPIMSCSLVLREKQVLINLADEKLNELKDLDSICIMVHVYIPDLDGD